MAEIDIPEELLDKPFVVLSFSRKTLLTLGLSYEQVGRLSDEDMTRIAEISIAHHFDSEFDENVKFTVRLVLEEKRKQAL